MPIDKKKMFCENPECIAHVEPKRERKGYNEVEIQILNIMIDFQKKSLTRHRFVDEFCGQKPQKEVFFCSICATAIKMTTWNKF